MSSSHLLREDTATDRSHKTIKPSLLGANLSITHKLEG